MSHKDLRDLAAALLAAGGTEGSEAGAVADGLIWADLVGRSTQGVWCLKTLLARLRNGFIQSPCSPEFLQKTDGIALVDGHNGFGRYVGQIAMTRAIEVARRCGTGLVMVRNSSHFGAAAYYVQLAAQAGMIGLALTNALGRVAAHGGLRPIFGTNPVAFGAPLKGGESVLVDFSTSMIAGSVLRKGLESNEPVPQGVAVDEHGQPATKPTEVCALLPFGGAKGYCLSLMVEILTGVITGSLMSFQIPYILEKTQRVARIGHAFLVIDIAALLPLSEYYERMAMLLTAIKESPLQPGVSEVLIPGESRWRNYRKQISDGILLDRKIIESLESLAAELKITTPW
ncbi:MAG TPA: Ldh family oxidoreductase [Chthoniobacterales bacterium]|nr:Ldh family oxidoreductase [Chthoniobacterales bacterium]